MAGSPVVAILTRAPSAGGKSRLFHALGRASDPDLLRAMLVDTVDAARLAGTSCVIAVEPPGACDEIRSLVPGARVIPQVDGTLGDRMRAVIRELLAGGASAVALVGSDLPEIDRAVIADAFARLARRPESLVLGPTADGGYYLIAVTTTPDVFEAIDWGSSAVLAQTCGAAERLGLHVELVATGEDVDTIADLQRVAHGTRDVAPRTRAWARAHGITRG